MNSFEQSNLWKKNLANQGSNDPNAEARERLRQAFVKTRLAVKPLVDQIAKELPDLTMHDITHLDSLWGIADVLIGNDFEINPAETFVLGMTFLLHDAACSTFAFPKGIESLRNTLVWKDFVAQKKFDTEAMKKGSLEYQQTLFETLRLMHSQQAEKLLAQSWDDLNGEQRFLMEDVELRNHYGRDIGKIAASHGKDAAIAEQEWANAAPLTLHSSFKLDSNTEWKVDRLKMAMLLRCIDAAHIDSRRAPDMLACLSQPTGESREHWLFQNRLGAMAINNQSELYWSGQTFEEKDSDAWWRCYETAKMIDHEIRIANRILKNNSRKELSARGVAGAQDISVFLKNVPVQGWHPVDVSFQIRDVGDVIEKFGGAKLYGEKPHLALRELIQNAADAIRALRVYRNKTQHGRIDISLTEENGAWWLHVQDDGIGMSRYVLTDVLLDFGRSLWRDASLREQWAGLAGSGFEAVGQFGIGFFSVFMLGDEIKVTTWRYGDAEHDQATLHLRQRTNAKPILLNTPIDQKLGEFGTRVSVCLRGGRASLLPKFQANSRVISHLNETPVQEMTLDQVVGALAPALDIDVWCQDGLSEKTQTIEANDWEKLPPVKLLQRIAPICSEDTLRSYTEGFFDLKEKDGAVVGRASINSAPFSRFGGELGILVHKGISMSKWNCCGMLLSSNNENLARSHALPICSADALSSWARISYSMMQKKKSPWLSNRLLSLGLPAGQLPVGTLGGYYVTPKKIKSHLQQHGLEEIVLALEDPDCPGSMARDDFHSQFELSDAVIAINNFERREDFGLGEWISSLLPDTGEFPRNIQSAVERCILKTWPNATSKIEMRVVGSACGEEIDANCLVFKKTGSVD